MLDNAYCKVASEEKISTNLRTESDDVSREKFTKILFFPAEGCRAVVQEHQGDLVMKKSRTKKEPQK